MGNMRHNPFLNKIKLEEGRSFSHRWLETYRTLVLHSTEEDLGSKLEVRGLWFSTVRTVGLDLRSKLRKRPFVFFRQEEDFWSSTIRKRTLVLSRQKESFCSLFNYFYNKKVKKKKHVKNKDAVQARNI